ncbi:hypothetical protein SAMN05216337_1002346 [Bradyrhizobium brasilense]|uniref:Uncharacterized protein n=1 Tax=Bradyrhizobium brasilense TaxID=1419277 RepID=A0A1G6L6H1_9BRAD|nr:hypothetical protein SAMN05216337_1002346 [Bradyrhizobium brasilense]
MDWFSQGMLKLNRLPFRKIFVIPCTDNVCEHVPEKHGERAMSETYKVIVSGKPEIRELTFAFEPRVGDLVRLPDLDGDLHCRVDRVVHYARLPHSNQVADACFVIVPEKSAKV